MLAGGTVLPRRRGRRLCEWRLPHRVSIGSASVALALAPVALLGAVGADARWLAALGATIAAHRQIPAGVPFAALPTAGWHNVPVLAELIFHWLEQLGGERALLVAQLAAGAGALALVERDARAEGADEQQTALVPPLVVLVAAPAFLVVRAQLFSLLFFPALLALLRAEARRPSRRIWLVPPVLALWTNLHGAVLVGLGALGCYLLCERLRQRPLETLSLALIATGGLLATPGLLDTPTYFRGVLGNEAARRGVGLWAPLSFSSGWDILLAAGALLLLACALWARPRPFELVLLAGLALMTVQTGRSGIWLVLAAAVPAARALPLRGGHAALRFETMVLALATLLTALGLARGPGLFGASGQMLARVVTLAHGRPVLAEDALAEQVALAGGRIWAGDPIDAFASADQRRYVAWLRGERAGDQLLRKAQLVLVRRGSASARRLSARGGFGAVAADSRTLLYERRPVGRGFASSRRRQ